MITKPFEIYLANLNPKKGHEVGKTRPVVVIHSQLIEGLLSTSIVCPITTQIAAATLLRVHIPFQDASKTGLTEPSDIIVDQIRSIDNQRLINKLGELPPAQIEQLQKSLQTILAVH
ncbi:MAG: type II toxin-antitoxin system PemK/MazF family toxin [Bacteroidetes bacterium]|nr:type II toxin-antitoxin system PemK/MazF family toxin [Bacteroidota bacterium]